MADATWRDVLSGKAKWAIDTANVLPYLKSLPDECVQCCVTSPPYFGLRSYLPDDHPDKVHEIGTEKTPQEYVAKLVEVFREVRRVLHPTGTVWLNIGDSYASGPRGNKQPGGGNLTNSNIGSDVEHARWEGAKNAVDKSRLPGIKPKDLIGVPWRLAFALQDDGWYLRQDIIWSKPSPMPSSVRDRCTTSHEYIFLLTKSPRYFFDNEAIAEEAATTGKVQRTTDRYNTAARYGADNGGNGGLDKLAARMRDGDHATRNKRSVWTVATTPFKGAHFAAFPPKLIEPCILAGTPEKGVCPDCGQPWRRKVEKKRVATRPGTVSKVYESNGSKQAETGNRQYTGFNARWKSAQEVGNRDPQRHVTSVKTVGWKAGCACDKAPVPAVVLDPFGGAGTTVLVATRLVKTGAGCGRRAIASELNPEYARMARKRILTASRGLVS